MTRTRGIETREKLLKRKKKKIVKEFCTIILIGLIEDTARISVLLKKVFHEKKFEQFARRTNSQMENVYKGRNKYGKRKKWSPADASLLRQTHPPRRANNRGFGLSWQTGKYGYRQRLLSPRCINSIRPEDSGRNSLPSASEQENAQQNLAPADVFFPQ